MAKYLVIVEAPKKISSYAKYLGKDYHVMATAGHVIDLPAKNINVKITKDKAGDYTFEPNYEIIQGREATVQQIIKESSRYQAVYLMTDPDREGEAIGWHVGNKLPKGTQIFRASTNSITKAGVDAALNNARSIDNDLVNSYETRRILDRLVGYKCSFLTQMATGGRSVGRVQSAALRILAEREIEIQNFKPEEYWDISCELLGVDTITNAKAKVLAKLVKPDQMEINDKTKADKIVADLRPATVTVTKYDVKTVSSKPYGPFTTSTLQQAASTILGWNQKKTMNVAQKLYGAGDITYHRTDSTMISAYNLGKITSYIQASFAPAYLPSQPNVYKTTAKNAQEAHEAILPTDPNNLNAGADADEKKLYKLVWQRAIACQMSDSQTETVSVRYAYKDYELASNGHKLLFDGWKLVWKHSLSADILLPALKVGSTLDVIDIIAEQKFTQPPPRYSGASFVKMLEKTGIGRPATFQSITDTLVARNYIEDKNRSFTVTDLGLAVVAFLKSANFCFIDLQFTADMEEDLDKISNQQAKKEKVLDTFYKRLLQDIDAGKKIKVVAQVSGHKCLKCGKNLLKKHSRFGPFYACEDKEGCGVIANIAEDGTPLEKKAKEYGPSPCQTCGARMVKRTSKFGVFFGCEKFSTGCRGMRAEDGTPIVAKEKTSFSKFPRKQKGKKIEENVDG